MSPGLDFYSTEPTDIINAPGTKSEWTEQDNMWCDGIIDKQRRGEPTGAICCLGGGNVAILGSLAEQGCDVTMQSVLGPQGDMVSDTIAQQLWQLQQTQRLPMRMLIQRAVGFDVGKCRIDWQRGGNSASRGSQRSEINDFIDTEHAVSLASAADIAVVTGRHTMLDLIQEMPDHIKYAFTPSGRDCKNSPNVVLDKMRARRPYLLTFKKEGEASDLFPDYSVSTREMTLRATRYASHVLCTMDKDGMYYAEEGMEIKDVIYQPAIRVPAQSILDTTGAGERAQAQLLSGLMLGKEPATLLEQVAHSCATVIQFIGALGDLQPSQFTIM